jgi:hypothetical protein
MVNYLKDLKMRQAKKLNMKLLTIVLTRNKAISVKTLHTILRLNITCLETKTMNEICFINDNLQERRDYLTQRLLKDTGVDRILWLDYSVSLDNESINIAVKPFEVNGCHGIVFPGVTEGVDWNMFKEKILAKSSEPIHQVGLNFDTEVDTKVPKFPHLYTIKTTTPKSWVIDVKHVYKKIGSQKLPLLPSELFKLFMTHNKFLAFVDAQVTLTYTHECLGNIMNSAGVSTSNKE